MRFALDLKDRLKVENVCKYLSGTIYPDSRHFTKVDRALTHPSELLERDPLTLTDFEKGWFAHLLCDRVQYRLVMDTFPDIAQMEDGEGSGWWTELTALKVLQDLDDIQKFDIESHLHCFAYVFNPNNEEVEKVTEYNAMCSDLYISPGTMTIDSFTLMWERARTSPTVSLGIMEAAKRRATDEKAMNLIRNLYPKMLELAEEFLRK